MIRWEAISLWINLLVALSCIFQIGIGIEIAIEKWSLKHAPGVDSDFDTDSDFDFDFG